MKTERLEEQALTLALDVPASVQPLDVQLEDGVGAGGAVVLGRLGGGTVLIGQSDQA